MDNITSPRAASITLISAETKRICLELYFRCFATSTPLLHEPTFNPDRRGSGFIRTMVAIGGSYSSDLDIRNIAKRVLSEEWSSMRLLFTTLTTDDPRSFDVISEVLLLTFFSLGHLDQYRFDDSRDLLLEAIQFARRLGLGSALISTATGAPETLHQRWLEWVKYESWKRLALLYLVVDVLLACVFNTAPHMPLLELKQNMPVDEIIWNARSAEEWQHACLATSANTESPVIDAMHLLINSYNVPTNLNELSSITLSTCLLTSICELSTWKVLYTTRSRSNPRRHRQHLQHQQPRVSTDKLYGHEIVVREAQLRFAMNVLLDRARNQRMVNNLSSPMWDLTSTIQQLGYLRLYLPSAQTLHGIVSRDWRSVMNDTMLAIAGEDLGVIEYRPVTLLLNWFSELMLSQIHLQYQTSKKGRGQHIKPTESTIGCVALVQAMIDLWRLVKYTSTHEVEISQSPEHALARVSFLDTITELTESVLGPIEHASKTVPADEFARALSQLCSSMYQHTLMGTFDVAAQTFGNLVILLQTDGPLERSSDGATMGAWSMISRCF